MQPTPWSEIAFNQATDSENRIHSDEVARQYGFRGGLVPGVTVFAYLVHPALVACLDALPHPEEIDYLCSAASEYFTEPVTWDDIVWTYSAVRPLFDNGASKAQEVTRSMGRRSSRSSLPVSGS